MLFSKHFSIEKRFYLAIAFLLISFLLVLFGFDKEISAYLLGMGVLGAGIAGGFYTLGVTTPFAMVVILDLMRLENAYTVVAVACAAATLVDCALFYIFRAALEKNAKKLMKYFHGKFKRFSGAFPYAGFFVFGLPLPDEIGLALMEMTTINIFKLGAVIFCAKFIMLILAWKALGG